MKRIVMCDNSARWKELELEKGVLELHTGDMLSCLCVHDITEVSKMSDDDVGECLLLIIHTSNENAAGFLKDFKGSCPVLMFSGDSRPNWAFDTERRLFVSQEVLQKRLFLFLREWLNQGFASTPPFAVFQCRPDFIGKLLAFDVLVQEACLCGATLEEDWFCDVKDTLAGIFKECDSQGLFKAMHLRNMPTALQSSFSIMLFPGDKPSPFVNACLSVVFDRKGEIRGLLDDKTLLASIHECYMRLVSEYAIYCNLQ